MGEGWWWRRRKVKGSRGIEYMARWRQAGKMYHGAIVERVGALGRGSGKGREREILRKRE